MFEHKQQRVSPEIYLNWYNTVLPVQLVIVLLLLNKPVTCCFLRLVICVSINLSAPSLSHVRRNMRRHHSAAGRLLLSDQNRKWLRAEILTLVTSNTWSVRSHEKSEMISEETWKLLLTSWKISWDNWFAHWVSVKFAAVPAATWRWCSLSTVGQTCRVCPEVVARRKVRSWPVWGVYHP